MHWENVTGKKNREEKSYHQTQFGRAEKNRFSNLLLSEREVLLSSKPGLLNECRACQNSGDLPVDDGSWNLDDEKMKHLEEEVGDVLTYLVNLCGKFNIDPIQAAKKKSKSAKRSIPAELVKGNSKTILSK